MKREQIFIPSVSVYRVALNVYSVSVKEENLCSQSLDKIYIASGLIFYRQRSNFKFRRNRAESLETS